MKIPDEWLTTREAAELLGVHPNRLRAMRETGRIRGEQLWGRKKPMRFWYFPLWEVEKLLADEWYLAARAKWRARQEKQKVSSVDKIKIARPAGSLREGDLSEVMREMQQWEMLPEPEWACERRRL